MSAISVNPYWPTSTYDHETGRLVPNLNFFSDLMAEQAELAKKGESKLTQEEIEEYSGKCDMSQMSREERDDFLKFLYDKGIIDHPRSTDCDHEIQSSRPGEHGAWIVAEGAEAEAKWGEHADLGPRYVVLFLCSCLDEMHKELLAEQAVPSCASFYHKRTASRCSVSVVKPPFTQYISRFPVNQSRWEGGS